MYDITNGYAYWGCDVSPAIVVKVAIGSGAALPTRIGSVVFNSGQNFAESIVLDTTSGVAYVGLYTTPGK